jgi:outer membrane receptor protein involved in Fe transport
MGGDGSKLWACAAIAAFAAAPPAWAQDAPAPPAQTAAPSDAQQEEEIVVRADGDQVRIDRRIYAIHNDPIAQSTDMFDVLGRIPSVSVDPSGSVTLLGAGSPQIQINGQPLPQGASVEQVLRGLQGADVERIEVITNPSAQYSSATSGGIINIITRNRYDRGFSGNANVSGDSFGGAQGSFAPSWSGGPWSLGGRLGYYDSQSERAFHSQRDDLTTGDITDDDGANAYDYHGLGASLQATYQHDPKNKATLSIDSYAGDGASTQDTDRITNGAPVFHQDQRDASSYNYNRIGFQMQHDGAKPREQLRLDAEISQNEFGDDTNVAIDPASGPPPSPFLSRNTDRIDDAKLTLDYDLPLGVTEFFTAGLSAETQSQHVGDLQKTLVGPPGPGDFESSLVGREQTLAAYGTYQFGFRDWLFLPGLRAENYRREVTSAGGATDGSDLRLFPTVHVRRSFEHIDIDVSYTSRINRPDVSSLDPAIRFSDATHALSGNPNLRPGLVDAYEANFTYQKNDETFSLTFFDRINHDITSTLVSQVGDVTLSSLVNAGDSEERGLEATLRGALGRRWRYTFTANALDNSFDSLRNGAIVHDSAFEYYGNASIEYRDPNQTQVGADDIQLEVRFQGPQHELQQETNPSYFLNFSWRRRLSAHLFGFVQVQDIFATREYRSLLRADDFTERTMLESPGARFRLSLTYQFGNNPNDRPPPPPSEGGGGGPH